MATSARYPGIVKQVISGDTVIIRGQPKGGPPPERQLCLSNITARKLARRGNPNTEAAQSTKDEPFAWNARELLRKKLVGKEVIFSIEYKVPGTGREYGCIYLGRDENAENVTETLLAEGLVELRKGSMKQTEEQKKLYDLEEAARSAGKGLWAREGAQTHVRDIKWTIDNPQHFVDSMKQKPIKAIIEHVRDGSTIRAFLLPDFQYVTVMLSGIRCPMFKVSGAGAQEDAEPFAEEAKYFTESRLLQRDVEIILEGVNGNNFLGSVLHPNGNIAIPLLQEGFAHCVDWSMGFVTSGIDKLRAAEKQAKEKRLRIWKGYTPTAQPINSKEKEYIGTVVEVVNGDSLMVKQSEGNVKKIFLASIRPPRLTDSQPADPSTKEVKPGKNVRPIYDIPYMYEAREFLRKKLIGKKVNVVIDYIQPASNALPEKTCCTVTIGGVNVAEALVSKGLATVVRYRQDDDQRSSHYDELFAAEIKAVKTLKGLHSKKDPPVHRVTDVSLDHSKAKQFFPFLQRAGRTDAVVEYVASGSRVRLYIPKETCLITLLLAGINCPRVARILPNGTAAEGEPCGAEALTFTKELCLQREVEVEVESMDKVGNYIGWLYVEGANLSIALVEAGLAKVHFTAERSVHYRALQVAEENSKSTKTKIWANYEEPKEQEPRDDVTERHIDFKSIVITDVQPDLHFYAQHVDDGPKLEELMQQIRQNFEANPPLPGAYNPKKGDTCAAKFVDGLWYRAKVEKVVDSNNIHIFYVDYGNRQVTKAVDLSSLPNAFVSFPHAAHQYALACAVVPTDPEYKQEALQSFIAETQDKTILMNTEYKLLGAEYVSLQTESREDIIRGLIGEGYLLVENRREKKLQKLISEYKNAQDSAKKKRLNIWCYGDLTEDDAKEFGYQR